MGIDNRDYSQYEPQYNQGGGGGGLQFSNPFAGMGVVTKRIIIVTAVVYLLQIMGQVPATSGGVNEVTGWLKLSLPDLQQGQVWRLLTYAFCHSEGKIFHILFNMVFVWWLGKSLESLYGSKEYLCFYLTAAMAAGLAFIGLDLATATDLSRSPAVVGASGAVMGIMMLYACHFPKQVVNVWGIFPIQVRWLIAGFVIMDLLPVLSSFSDPSKSDGVAHSAHLGGLLFGYLHYRFHWRISSLFGSWKLPDVSRSFGSRSKIKLYAPPEEKIKAAEAELDALLIKIQNDGIDSLTKKERKKLEQASKDANRRLKKD